ncbi:MAG: VanZ family protein [Syntrophomonadaceae bacterium]
MTDAPSAPETDLDAESEQPKARRKWLPLVAFIIFLAGVAHFSNQPSREQDLSPWIKQCPGLLQLVRKLPHIRINYEGYIKDNHTNTVAFIEFCIRKFVHFCIYGTLGLLVLYNLKGFGLKDKRLYVCAALIILMVAGLDEWNQLSVPGRSGMYYDVIVDFLGFTVFAFLGRKRFSAL